MSSSSAVELGWLLLAHLYVQKGQFDTAQGLCERCLAANRSCARAYELIGTIKEKQSGEAERLRRGGGQLQGGVARSSEAAAAIGFTLAFNVLQGARRHATRAGRPPVDPPALPSA